MILKAGGVIEQAVGASHGGGSGIFTVILFVLRGDEMRAHCLEVKHSHAVHGRYKYGSLSRQDKKSRI
jgi:hypothetical protein